jgi:hypothetical protein
MEPDKNKTQKLVNFLNFATGYNINNTLGEKNTANIYDELTCQ